MESRDERIAALEADLREKEGCQGSPVSKLEQERDSLKLALLDMTKKFQHAARALEEAPAAEPSAIRSQSSASFVVVVGFALAWGLLLSLWASTSGAADLAISGHWGEAIRALSSPGTQQSSDAVAAVCPAGSLAASINVLRTQWDLPALPE